MPAHDRVSQGETTGSSSHMEYGSLCNRLASFGVEEVPTKPDGSIRHFQRTQNGEFYSVWVDATAGFMVHGRVVCSLASRFGITCDDWEADEHDG